MSLLYHRNTSVVGTGGSDIVSDWVETEDAFLFFKTGVAKYAALTFTDTSPGAGGDVGITLASDPTIRQPLRARTLRTPSRSLHAIAKPIPKHLLVTAQN